MFSGCKCNLKVKHYMEKRLKFMAHMRKTESHFEFHVSLTDNCLRKYSVILKFNRIYEPHILQINILTR